MQRREVDNNEKKRAPSSLMILLRELWEPIGRGDNHRRRFLFYRAESQLPGQKWSRPCMVKFIPLPLLTPSHVVLNENNNPYKHDDYLCDGFPLNLSVDDQRNLCLFSAAQQRQHQKRRGNKRDRSSRKRNDGLSFQEFDAERKNAQLLSQLGLGVRILATGVVTMSFVNGQDAKRPHPQYYRFGYIAMQMGDQSAKDILLRRDFAPTEMQVLNQLIEQLHAHGWSHGDCKPSNIVVFGYASSGGQGFTHALFISCRHVRPLTTSDLAAQDWATFQRHVDKNRRQRQTGRLLGA